MKMLLTSLLLFLKISFLPSAPLLFYMGVAVALDFCTGVAKSKLMNVARTSSGYRKTVIKFLQYGGALAIGAVLANIGDSDSSDLSRQMLSYFNNGLIIFIIYIEVTSVLENLYIMDQKTIFSKYFIAPALKILTWQIKNNPIIQQSKNLRSSKKEGDEKNSL